MLLIMVAVGAATAVWFFVLAKPNSPMAVVRVVKAAEPPPGRVAALGRIEPLDRVIRVSARSTAGQAALIGELMVKEGDSVKAGQLLAVLDNRRQLEAMIRDLEAQVAVAEQRVAVVRAAARDSDIAAQQAEISRLEVVLKNAQTDADRFGRLFAKDSATVLERDRPVVEVETTQQAINAAKARLAGLSEVRASDVKLAESQVTAAKASVARAQTDLETVFIHAPYSGRVLKIYAYKGSQVGPDGLLEIARTDQMYAIAEVYETDIGRVHIGQSATVSGGALAAPLQGHVEYISPTVARNGVNQTDPVSLSDARIVEVKVRLDDPVAAAKLIHGQVNVVIEP